MQGGGEQKTKKILFWLINSFFSFQQAWPTDHFQSLPTTGNAINYLGGTQIHQT
jgi:hypothetical protein